MKQSEIAGRVAVEVALSKADAEVAVNAVSTRCFAKVSRRRTRAGFAAPSRR